MNILGAKSCSSLEFSFELLLFLVPSQLTSDSKGRCITKCLPKTKKKICTANCFQFILCMIEIINHNLLFKLETSICSSFLALIGKTINVSLVFSFSIVVHYIQWLFFFSFCGYLFVTGLNTHQHCTQRITCTSNICHAGVKDLHLCSKEVFQGLNFSLWVYEIHPR